jgi:hypothetical protein
MNPRANVSLPAGLAAELEKKFFWWQNTATAPRSDTRILAQAMDLASFEDIVRLEAELGPDRLADAMLGAAPGWISERSWEFWRGRLSRAGRHIPEAPPRRAFDVAQS